MRRIAILSILFISFLCISCSRNKELSSSINGLEETNVNENSYDQFIIDIIDNDSLGFFDLKKGDDIETSIAKLITAGKDIGHGSDYVEGIYVIYPNDQNLNEQLNLDFLISFYNNKLNYFKKFNIEENYKILLKEYFLDNGKRDKRVSYFRYIIEKDNYRYIYNEYRNMGILMIRNTDFEEEIMKKYDEAG